MRSSIAGSSRAVPDAFWSRQTRAWLVVAAVLALAGCVAIGVAASVQSTHDTQKAREAFAASSAGVASTLRLAIQHEQDLIVGAGAFLATNPHASNAQFVHWTAAARAFQRYPELLGLGHAVIVPASGLAAFAKAAERDPPGPLSANGTFQVLPPGRRSFYCFALQEAGRTVQDTEPAGYDFCDQGGPANLSSRDSGADTYVPIRTGTNTLLAVQTPVYAGGVVPAAVAERRANFLGWVGMTVVPEVVLDQALAGHPGLAVTFSYRGGASNAAFHAGKVAPGAQSVAIDLHNGWTVRTFSVLPATGLFAHGRPGALLLAGIALSVLLAALVFVLGTGRARARRLVSVKTGELRHQALHDGLTGLPNRALISDRIEQLLARSRRTGGAGAVLFVDLDEFKSVNDTLGHEAGDQLLQAVAARLTAGLREVDTVGRLGGDEFVVLVDDESRLAAQLLAERLLELLRQPFEIECSPTPILITASVGAAVGVRDTAGELLRDADMALYAAKAAGKNRYEVFQPEMESVLRRNLGIDLDLRSALVNDEYRLVYQPIYNLDDLTLVGVEALLRWHHPTLGVVAPEQFIPKLEASGRIREVGHWVLDTACQQMADWHAQGTTLGVSVNVSARQLDDDAIVDDIRGALTTSQLDPAALTIEITETALMRNVDATARRLNEIRQLGVSVAIDDFGTGYSSLASLQQFSIDTIKIDRAFTDAINRSPESDALIRVLVQLGRDLGLRTLAEGVETIDQLDHLRNEHVDDAQGFLLSKPLAPDDLQRLILPELSPHDSVKRAPTSSMS